MNRLPEIEYKRFMTHIGHWSWVHLMYRFSAKHLIVADFEFIQFLRSARSEKLQCHIATPEEVAGLELGGIEKVLVFLKAHEISTVRKLSILYPDATVCSATYGFACVGPNRTPKFSKLTTARPKMVRHKALFLSTSYAGVEFLGAAMGENGLPVPHEYFARPLVRWLDQHRGFQPLRFLAEIESRFLTKEGEVPLQVLQMDVLGAMLQYSNLSFRRFVQFLKDQDIKIVSFRRGDLLAQVAEAQLLDHTAERSVWTKKPSKKLQNKLEQVPFAACVERMHQLKHEEALLADIEASVAADNVLRLSLEEFAEDQSIGLSQVAGHIGLELPEGVIEMDYTSGYATAADIGWLTDVVVRQFIDNVGLHQLPVPIADRLEIQSV